MSLFKNLSLQRKLTTIIMLTSCIALLLACAAFVAYELSTFKRNLVQEMTMLADVTGKNCSAALNFDAPGSTENAEETLANLGGDSRLMAACIYKNGKIWARFPKTLNDSALPVQPAPGSNRFENNSLLLFREIHDPDNAKVIGTIFLQSNLSQMYSRIRQYVGIVAVVLVVASVVALLISSGLQRVVSQPLLNLSATARTVSEKKDYSVRAQKLSEDEVGQLIESFNDMLATIQKRDRELQ